jgi:hypothetical protein
VLAAVWSFVRDYFDVAGAVAAFVASIWYSRWPSRSRAQLLIVWIMIRVALSYFAAFLVAPHSVTLRQLSVMLICYAAALYALICDALRFGWAERLTKKRGPNWIKELDYLYLGLGALGIIGSINRLPAVGDHHTRLDFLGPIILTSALVVRLVKTRADIDGCRRGVGRN